jgi:hypothetical protein
MSASSTTVGPCGDCSKTFLLRGLPPDKPDEAEQKEKEKETSAAGPPGRTTPMNKEGQEVDGAAFGHGGALGSEKIAGTIPFGEKPTTLL